MLIYPARLTDLTSLHNYQAEVCIAQWFAQWTKWPVLYEPKASYFPDWDFVIAHSNSRKVARVEIKISAKGNYDGSLEISRSDGSPSGLTATTADFYLMLNVASRSTGKIRAIRTEHLRQYAASRIHTAIDLPTRGTNIGSKVLPLNLTSSQIQDLMIAELPWDSSTGAFDFDPARFKYNTFANRNISRFLVDDNWYSSK